jgi:hypothetical protein
MKSYRWKIKASSPGTLLARKEMARNTSATFEGIKITHRWDRYAHYEDFVRITCEALQLIQDYSPRHLQRLQRHVHFISYQRLLSSGAWDTATATCRIDFSQFYPAFTPEHLTEEFTYEWQLTHYAGVLIHEATHARLEALGFPYTKKTYRRIEHICETEERRFWWAVYEFNDTEKQESLQEIDLEGYDHSFHLSLGKRIQKAREIIKELNRKESAES